jgi:hypothetical protein
MKKCVGAVDFKVLDLLALYPAHTVRHVLGPLDCGLEELRLATKNVTKVNVQYLAALGHQDIIKVPVADAQNESDDRVASL